MKKTLFTVMIAAIAFAACQKFETSELSAQGPVITAQIDQDDQTRTAMGSDRKSAWSAKDQIAVFLKSNTKSKYEVQSAYVGKSYADFSSLSNTASGSGEHVVALYPYSAAGDLSLTNANFAYHMLKVTLPTEQTYASGSFGNGAFMMTALSTDYNLNFKNVCGGMKLQLKGAMKIASITVSGKNNEKIAGAATLQIMKDGSGAQFQGNTGGDKTSVTLNCGSGVQLNEKTATEFIIVLPPVTFSKGFNVSIKDTEGNTYNLNSTTSNTVKRSSLLVMPEKSLKTPSIADNLSGWTNVSGNYGTLPDHIKVYKAPSTLQGRSCNAYIAVTDLRLGGRWDVWSVAVDRDDNNGADGWLTYKTNDSFCTPSTIYNSGYWQNPPVVVNGGFFYYGDDGYNYTASLAIRNGETQDPLAYNINYEYNGSTLCYPTRGAFLEKADGTFDACWTYAKFNWYEHFVYPTPAPANSTTQPSLDYPSGGNYFAAKTGIGGGPVLIRDGEIKNTWSQEMLSGITPTSAQPRTAVGVTANREVVLFVCQGRGTYDGFTTAEVANILRNIGCVEAINLDGGGSTCMLVNGQALFTPSDGSQRAVASTVMIY